MAVKQGMQTILVVDDEEDLVRGLVRILEGAGYRVHSAFNGREALEKARTVAPDLILLDVMMPGYDGRQVKARLNDDELLARIPVIFLSAKGTTEDKLEGLHLEADDYVTKPFEMEELLARINTAIRRRRHYEKVSMTDGLTGLANFQFFKKEIDLIFNIAKRYARTFSVAVIDIDNLKPVNDRFGHKCGDAVIKAIAEAIRQSIRKADLAVRYGGDEFVVIFPECGESEARQAMEKIRKGVEELRYVVPETGESLSLSVSTGIASYEPRVENPWEIFEAADRQMYREKNSKRGAGPQKK